MGKNKLKQTKTKTVTLLITLTIKKESASSYQSLGVLAHPKENVK